MDIIGNTCRRIKSWITAEIASHTSIVSAHHTDHKAAQAESAEFKDVNIPVGEAYKQATEIMLRIKELNTFVGVDAGKVTTGNYNNFIGYWAGYSNTTGYDNNFIGYKTGYCNTSGFRNNFLGSYAGYINTTGEYNTFLGFAAGNFNSTGYRNSFTGGYTGHLNTTGFHNNFMGYSTGFSNTTGYRNNFMGCSAGYRNTTGYQNTYVGYMAGFGNVTGNISVAIGHMAGYYETGSQKLFIDNLPRTNEADGRVKALIYGIFNAATANQMVRLNAKKVEMPQLGNYANDAAAAAGGIAVGGLYRNGNIVQVRIV